MDNYELVKQQAPILFAQSKKIEALAAAGYYDQMIDPVFDLLESALDLIDKFPNTFAAYVVATSVVSSAMRSADKFVEHEQVSYEFPFVLANYLLTATAEFLGRNTDDERCANMLTSNSMAALMMLNNYFSHVPAEKRDFELFVSYSQYVFEIFYSSALELKKANPSSDILPQALRIVEVLSGNGLEKIQIPLDSISVMVGKIKEMGEELTKLCDD